MNTVGCHILCVCILLTGCGQKPEVTEATVVSPPASSAPAVMVAETANPMDEATISNESRALALQHWKDETARIKEYESHASSVATNWMSVMSARTSRIHSIPNIQDLALVLRISLETDAAFLREPEPTDLPVIEAGAFWKSYGAALQLAEQKIRDRGDAVNAEQIAAHRRAVFK